MADKPSPKVEKAAKDLAADGHATIPETKRGLDQPKVPQDLPTGDHSRRP